MAPLEINAETTAAADPHTVYALLRDGATWPEWSPLGSFELERPAAGADGPEGVGAVRIFRTGPVHSHEQIVELVPDRRLSYILVSGLPLKGYRADVDLVAEGGGTHIRWRSTFHAKVPGTGWYFRRRLQGFLEQMVAGLARRAAAEASVTAAVG